MIARRVLASLGLVGVLAVVSIPAASAGASVPLQSGTGTPSPSATVPVVTSTGTLNACAVTGTPTSPFPTVVLPTLGTPGTIVPTGTAITPTGSPAPSPTASGTPVPSGVITLCSLSYNDTGNCSVAADGQSAHFNISYTNAGWNQVAWSVTVLGVGTARMVPLVAYSGTYNGTPPPGQIHRLIWRHYFGTTVVLDDSYHPGSVDGVFSTTLEQPFNVTGTGAVFAAGVNLYQDYMNSNQTGVVDVYLNTNYLTPAAPTPTGTPVGCSPVSEIIDTEFLEWTPPVIVPGACYTVLPSLTIDIPEAVQALSPWELSTIGVQGIEICVSNLQMGMALMGFDVMGALSWLCALVGAAMIVREFKT